MLTFMKSISSKNSTTNNTSEYNTTSNNTKSNLDDEGDDIALSLKRPDPSLCFKLKVKDNGDFDHHTEKSNPFLRFIDFIRGRNNKNNTHKKAIFKDEDKLYEKYFEKEVLSLSIPIITISTIVNIINIIINIINIIINILISLLITLLLISLLISLLLISLLISLLLISLLLLILLSLS